MKSVKYYVGAGCERPIQPAPRSVPAPWPPSPRSAPLHRFSPTRAHRSAPLHLIFGSLRSVFRSAHAPLTCSAQELVGCWKAAERRGHNPNPFKWMPKLTSIWVVQEWSDFSRIQCAWNWISDAQYFNFSAKRPEEHLQPCEQLTTCFLPDIWMIQGYLIYLLDNANAIYFSYSH